MGTLHYFCNFSWSLKLFLRCKKIKFAVYCEWDWILQMLSLYLLMFYALFFLILLIYWVTVILLILFKIFFNVYFWERERKRERVHMVERQRMRETENLKQSLCCHHKAWLGTQTHQPWDHDMSRSWTFNWLSHPSAMTMTDF